MTRKFKLEWFNVPGVSLGYTEVWDDFDIREDFSSCKNVTRFANKSKVGSSFIVFDISGTGFLVMTRVPNHTQTKYNMRSGE